jgi:hypothetical protein
MLVSALVSLGRMQKMLLRADVPNLDVSHHAEPAVELAGASFRCTTQAR